MSPGIKLYPKFYKKIISIDNLHKKSDGQKKEANLYTREQNKGRPTITINETH